MRRGTRKPHKLKVKRYASSLTDMNRNLATFYGAKLTDKLYMTELNEIFLNSMPKNWSNQAYMQGFDCGFITFKKAVDIFESMEIAESS